MILVAGSSSPRASAVTAVSIAAGCAACSRDFEGLFLGSESPSGAASSGSPAGGTSGTSGKPDFVDDCACIPCEEGSSPCKLTCPAGCKSCACEPFTCPAGQLCNVGCPRGVSCDVICPEKTACNVTCDDGACTCTGAGCDLTCFAVAKNICATQQSCSIECK